MKNRYFIFTTVLIIAILLGYWVKNQIGINLFKSVSLSKHFPFDRLQHNDIILNPKPGILLKDSFDSHSIIRNWGELWMREEGKVVQSFDTNGMNNSRCLVIKSRTEKSWSFAHNRFVQVKQGDVFGFSGFVKQDGDRPNTYLRVAAFDEKKDVVKWNYVTQKTDDVGKWVFVQKKFPILDDVTYLRFGLVGVGKGEYRFDNLIFQKYPKGAF